MAAGSGGSSKGKVVGSVTSNAATGLGIDHAGVERVREADRKSVV